MLLVPPSHLAQYDVPASVLSVLRDSAVEHVSIVGRRGPLQAAFTTKELREMMNLPDASMIPLDPALLEAAGNGNGNGTGAALTRQQSRTLQLLQKGSKNAFGTTRKTWSLDFFRSPTGLTTPTPGLVSSSERASVTLHLAHTTLDPSQRVVPTGETSDLLTDLVVTSLGHRAEPSAPWYDPTLGHIHTECGRILTTDGRIVRNVYASGWAAMGARGVLVSTMMNAYSVADTILQDHFHIDGERAQSLATAARDDPSPSTMKADMVEVLPPAADVDFDAVPPEVEAGLQEGRVTDFEDWKKIDAEEIRRGSETGKERERMVSWDEARNFLAEVRT